MQANSGNLNNFIHVPTHEFLEGRVRKAAADANHDDASHNRDEAAFQAEEVPAPPPQLAVEVDPQLVQAGEQCSPSNIIASESATCHVFDTCVLRSRALSR